MYQRLALPALAMLLDSPPINAALRQLFLNDRQRLGLHAGSVDRDAIEQIFRGRLASVGGNAVGIEFENHGLVTSK
jgi:hypothetical protein